MVTLPEKTMPQFGYYFRSHMYHHSLNDICKSSEAACTGDNAKQQMNSIQKQCNQSHQNIECFASLHGLHSEHMCHVSMNFVLHLSTTTAILGWFPQYGACIYTTILLVNLQLYRKIKSDAAKKKFHSPHSKKRNKP